jgi:hypothetical protein
VSTISASSGKLNALIRKYAAQAGPPLPDQEDPVAVLIQSYLIWEATTPLALAAYERIRSRVVDFNDFRVCLPPEMVEIIGPRYPFASERCNRLRASLNDLYHREHVVSFARASTMGKRDARAYVESLQSIVPFVSTRLLLISFDVHGVPIDEQRRQMFIAAGVFPAHATLAEIAAWFGRHVKADDALKHMSAMQAMVDECAERAPRSRGRAEPRAAKPAREPSTRAASPAPRKTAKKSPLKPKRAGSRKPST